MGSPPRFAASASLMAVMLATFGCRSMRSEVAEPLATYHACVTDGTAAIAEYYRSLDAYERESYFFDRSFDGHRLSIEEESQQEKSDPVPTPLSPDYQGF